MKKIILTILILIISVCFVGCTYGNGFSIGSVQNNTLSSMSMKYVKFSGNKNKDLTVKAGKIYNVNVDIKTEEGKINLLIKDDNGNIAYQGNNIPTSNFIVKLSEAGKYKISIEAKNHKGSYTIKWSK